MPKLKIAIIATTLVPPHPAGTQILQVVDLLSDEFEFTVFAKSIDKKLEGKVSFVKVPIPLVKPLMLRYAVQYFLFGRLFKKRKLDQQFDIVHVIEASCPYGNLVTMQYCGEAAKILMKQGIVTYNGWRQLYYKTLLWSGTIMENRLMRNKYLSGIIVPSKGLMNDMLKYHSSQAKISVIPNGVDIKQFKNAKVFRKEMRKQLGIGEDEFVGVIAGLGDWERKGLGYIIDAVRRLGNGQVKILVIGSNTDDYKSLCSKKQIEDSFVFIGITKELEKYYGLADFFILPTANEAWSVVTLMAAASGLPLLATKVNGVEDFIIEGSNGFFIERDGKDIAEKILNLKSGDFDIVTLGKNSAEYAQTFDSKKVAKQYAEYYYNFVHAKVKNDCTIPVLV